MANILPKDGEAVYFGKVIDDTAAAVLLDTLLNDIAWKHDEAIIFGRHITTKRMVAWYADQSYPYTYSGKTRQALIWTKELLELRNKIERLTNESFNACLLNLYHNGEEGMAWHSDDEKTLAPDSAIASLSFGADRRFLFKHRQSKELVTILLENGSLLLMKGTTQKNWLHSLPKSKKINQPRVNLTFRKMV